MNAEYKRYHEQTVEIVMRKFQEKNFTVSKRISKEHDFIVNGSKCVVWAHKNKVNSYTHKYSVAIPIASDKWDIMSADFDMIVYRDMNNNGTQDKFYYISKADLTSQIWSRMNNPRDPEYRIVNKESEITNSGSIIHIAERAFSNIPGIETFNL